MEKFLTTSELAAKLQVKPIIFSFKNKFHVGCSKHHYGRLVETKKEAIKLKMIDICEICARDLNG